MVTFIQDHSCHEKAWGFLPLSGGKNKLLEQFTPVLKMKLLLPLYVRYRIPEPVSPPPASQFMCFFEIFVCPGVPRSEVTVWQ